MSIRILFLAALVMSVLSGCTAAKIAKLPRMEGPEKQNTLFLQEPRNYLLGGGDRIRISLTNELLSTEERSSTTYFIEVGDILEINFFNHWQFNVTRTVRPDGYITVPLCGDILVRGFKTSQVATELSKCYSSVIEKPNITVNLYLVKSSRFKEIEGEYTVQNDGYVTLPKVGRIMAAGRTLDNLSEAVVRQLNTIYFDRLSVQTTLTNCANNKFYIAGEIGRPGVYDIDSRLTVLQALFKAGDVKSSGNIQKVVLIRRVADNIPQVRVLDLSRALLENDYCQDIIIYPYDIVFVPKSNIASIRQFLDDYLFDLLHLSTTMGFYYTKELNKITF